ncbi:pYEATS domain-containing protein [Mucilaginibacter paludis]|uniref:YEATS domain-containing protein n=1 Tax=Mucilaginibacter paludis DSM 18603 TaxID=714943 RepID=H1YBZ3_9SPHI|nr:pYEATS domain-containing protein [Mucilaginibacter paludis]EHQ27071.1 hypothetical protein Mucpa_2963 [Mucilaginibacter paludis DSM 18603]
MKFSFLVMLLLCLLTCVQGQVLHAFLFCKTNDKNIGKFIGINYVNMENQLKVIAAALKYKYGDHHLTSVDYNLHQVNDTLNHTDIKPDDIVVLYFSTHGGRTKNHTGMFPLLDIPDSAIESFKEHLILLNKQPKILITIIEACNGYAMLEKQDRFIMGLQSGIVSLQEKLDPNQTANLKKLFTTACEIIVTAGEVGKDTYTGPDGSPFTGYFLRSLNEYIAYNEKKRSEVNWSNVLDRAKTYTSNWTATTPIPTHPIWQLRQCGTPIFISGEVKYLQSFDAVEKRDVSLKITSRRRLRFKNPYDVTLNVINASNNPIDSVQYFLHYTMEHPVLTMTNPEQDFYLSMALWGTFPIKAKVFFADGKVYDLYKNFDFSKKFKLF